MARSLIDIFATQRKSEWVQKLLRYQNTFGHNDQPYSRRMMMALRAAGIVGQTLTSFEIEEAVARVIGSPHPDREKRHQQMTVGIGIGRRTGVLRPTGELRRVDGIGGQRKMWPSYEILGHIEVKGQRALPVI